MIRKVFLDTNIMVDWVTNRTPFVEEAEKIFTYQIDYYFDLYASALSIANLAYLMDSMKTRPHESILLLLRWIKIIDLTEEIIVKAANSDFKDFEDGLQHFSAKTVLDMDVIVTRNKKDFKHSSIQVLTPEEFIKKFDR